MGNPGFGPRRRGTALRATAAALLLAVGVFTAGCAPATPASPAARQATAPAAEKSGDMQVRHDAEPLTDRWPVLEGLESTSWSSGTMGGRAPGPSTYWVDAVVVLSPAAYEQLRATATEPVDAPELVSPMREHVPAGPFFGGADADAAVSTPGYPATVALDDATRTVVVSAVFGG